MRLPAAPPLVRLMLLSAALLAATTGCGQNSATSDAGAAPKQPSPRERLAALAARYRKAKTYQDAGELRFLVEGAPDDQYRSLPFSVAFERPNKIRVHALDTTSVADGQVLRAMVQSLPGQVLVLGCPAVVTLAALQTDAMFRDAMHGQLDVELPQLLLLAGNKPLDVLTRDCTPEQLSDSEFHGAKCWRIALRGPAGKSVLWIEQQSGLLVQYEFPLEEIRKKFPLARLWAEFRAPRSTRPWTPWPFRWSYPRTWCW